MLIRFQTTLAVLLVCVLATVSSSSKLVSTSENDQLTSTKRDRRQQKTDSNSNGVLYTAHHDANAGIGGCMHPSHAIWRAIEAASSLVPALQEGAARAFPAIKVRSLCPSPLHCIVRCSRAGGGSFPSATKETLPPIPNTNSIFFLKKTSLK